MVQPGINGLDTPRTNVGDATYLSRQPNFDISQELSFQSPSKDANLLQQLRNGGRQNLKTPRGSRAPFNDRRNLPAGLGGPEFTPLLKSATRNSARRYGGGKENPGRATPGFLAKIDEDMTPMPAGETSMYGASRNTSSFMTNTPLPEVDSSSAASTPLVMRRRENGKGPLENGSQLSLREQQNVIDKIEKENFGLKLKIHFLEEALRKAGPGFSEAALKENTDLKVDKVTMQRELQKYKKHLTSAEKDLENYRQQILEIQEKAKRKYADESQRAEIERLRQALEAKEAEIDNLHRQLEEQDEEDEIERLRQQLEAKDTEIDNLHRQLEEQDGEDRIERLQDEIDDLKADLRRKDDVIAQHEDAVEDARQELESKEAEIEDLHRKLEEQEDGDKIEKLLDEIDKLKADLRRKDDTIARYQDEVEQERQEKGHDADRLREAKETMGELEANVRRLEQQVKDLKKKLQDALSQKDRAEADLAELQEELANKSVVTKGLSRQVEEKVARLQSEVESARQECASLEEERSGQQREIDDLRAKLKDAREERDISERLRRSLEAKVQAEVEKARQECDSLEQELSAQQKDVDELRAKLNEAREERDNSERLRRSLEAKVDGAWRMEMDDVRYQLKEAREERDSAERIRLALEAKLCEMDDVKRQLKAAREERDAAERNQRSLEAKLGEMDDIKRQLKEARQELDAAERIRPTLESKSSEMEDIKRQLKEAREERDSAERIRLTLESKLRELEDENLVLEQAFEEAQTAAEDARAAAEQSAAAQQATFQRYKQKLEKYKRERDELASTLRDQHNNSTHSSVSEMAAEERRDLHKMLRESQLEADRLDRELRQHREALEELMGVESTLRKKLERARSERAAYRASAEKLQKDVKKLEVEKDKALAEAEAATAAAAAAAAAAAVNGDRALVHVSRANKHGVDTDAIIRAAEAAEKRHEKEIRGMVMQLEWLKACWDREARLRSDVAYAKRYVMMEVQIRDACNKADLAIINRIRAEINPSARAASKLGQRASTRGLEPYAVVPEKRKRQHKQLQPQRSRLRLALNAVRFIVRTQLYARNWAKNDKVRQRLLDCVDGMEREERIRKMRDQWRAEVARKTLPDQS
ncbi:uncharacterized protein B0T15DRAFT_532573 [Chaetomium strumarium]|uniref:Uncharacterized protein n=1 Tax=Chaetomium strumarium TaxID=1170767 RepID=A0AAJ0GTC1_9PEZI|nr:hypothetical protein B0T15DRAFT_532573 [Chaetomium strumarium]